MYYFTQTNLIHNSIGKSEKNIYYTENVYIRNPNLKIKN